MYFSARRPPNLMYIFSSAETKMLLEAYAPPQEYLWQGTLITIVGRHFCHPMLAERMKERLRMWRGIGLVKKVVIEATFPTTLIEPHHILEDGTQVDQPGREGPFRTYFDGSFINKLGHAVVVCIDKESRTITTQCSRGKDFAQSGEDILHDVFPDYERLTIRTVQQTDVHSCTAYALYNVLAMAGVKPVRDDLDILEWRAELLDKLDELGVKGEVSKSWLAEAWCYAKGPREAIQRWHNPPIYAKRYAQYDTVAHLAC